MFFRPKSKDVDPRERAVWGDLLAMGMVFPIAIVLGFFLGRWIGGYFGHREMGQWIGLVWGIATGFWELYKVNAKLDRLDKAQQDPKDHDDPH
jgi:hypothetical protein